MNKFSYKNLIAYTILFFFVMLLISFFTYLGGGNKGGGTNTITTGIPTTTPNAGPKVSITKFQSNVSLSGVSATSILNNIFLPATQNTYSPAILTPAYVAGKLSMTKQINGYANNLYTLYPGDPASNSVQLLLKGNKVAGSISSISALSVFKQFFTNSLGLDTNNAVFSIQKSNDVYIIKVIPLIEGKKMYNLQGDDFMSGTVSTSGQIVSITANDYVVKYSTGALYPGAAETDLAHLVLNGVVGEYSPDIPVQANILDVTVTNSNVSNVDTGYLYDENSRILYPVLFAQIAFSYRIHIVNHANIIVPLIPLTYLTIISPTPTPTGGTDNLPVNQ